MTRAERRVGPDRALRSLVERVPHIPSLRARALIGVLFVLLCPFVFILGSSWVDGGVGDRMRANVRQAAEETAATLVRTGGPDTPASAEIGAHASYRVVWIRVLDPTGAVVLDVDREQDSPLGRRMGQIFFGPDGAPSLGEFDRTLPPIAEREELEALTGDGPVVGCRTSPERKLFVCHAALRVEVGETPYRVYVQESTRRTIRALYDLDYQLKKLMLVVLPVALLLAWWLSWGMVRPIELLREQVLAKAAGAATTADLDLPWRDEVADLAGAFNSLLSSLDERSRANEAFVADLAHELKNPVAAIRASSEALEDGTPVTEERARRLAAILGDSSRRLDRLVTQFLELARAEAGMPDEERSTVDLAELARGIGRELGRDERWSGIRFVVDAPEAAPITGVPTRLESAIRNLAVNAASFAREEVGIHLEPLGTRGPGGGIRIRVTDDGPGIDPADLPRVFDRFFTTRGGARGTGLGLALVRAIVDAHGGRVRAESPPGAGASFEIELPAG